MAKFGGTMTNQIIPTLLVLTSILLLLAVGKLDLLFIVLPASLLLTLRSIPAAKKSSDAGKKKGVA